MLISVTLFLHKGTVNKKKMFYSMRSRTIQRNMSDLLARLESAKKDLLDLPNTRLRAINFAIKEVSTLSAHENASKTSFYGVLLLYVCPVNWLVALKRT